ncbi:MAG TPA: hypothetical protein VNA27_16510 [Rubrobacteraceae bacterium]|nr:hypothetical protein [Rubrobacteraceae bacterium]
MYFPISPDEEDPTEPDGGKLDEADDNIRRALKDLGFEQYVTDLRQHTVEPSAGGEAQAEAARRGFHRGPRALVQHPAWPSRLL